MNTGKTRRNTPRSEAENRQTRKYAIISALVAWMICCGLLFLPAWQPIEERTFDLLSLTTSPGKTQLPITIVGIDEASFTQLGVRWPWPRDMHARLVDRLAGAGAAVIAFDVMFPEPSSSPKEDEAFAKAISKAGNVVLAADHAYHETAFVRQWMRMDPISELTLAGATTGLATMALSDDAVARKFPGYDDAFWRETIRTLIRIHPNFVQEPYVPPKAMIRHLGPTHTFPYVSYYQVLNGDPNIPANFFADQIVLVGRDVRASPESGSAQADTFATPFLLTSKLLTPGVEIQATMIENAMMGQAIVPASRPQNFAALSVLMLLGGLSLFFWHPLRSGLLILALAATFWEASVWTFKTSNLWFATAGPISGLIIATVCMSAMSFLTERKRAGQIRNAFSLYVSRDVVDEIIAHPDRLKLGGERREITVLFCDLAGFTSISERLPPDTVSHIINRYLDEMTNIIMANEGTVVSFMGDGIMAFWGAPLDDSEHARHATRAAILMQEAMDRLQTYFTEQGAGYIGLRIGLHTGYAIVGNMGSTLRFDYTALGDTVNLASRLEGVNKAYKTKILLSADTATKLEDQVGLRRVDRVRVKGKDVPVDIFTPCSDLKVASLTNDAWAAYLDRDWELAATKWVELQAVYPDDPLATVYLERISTFKGAPPPKDWDGSVSLEKL